MTNPDTGETARAVGQRIRAARKTSGKTLRQCAIAAGVTPVTISLWERGQVESIGARALLRFADATNVNIRWLLDASVPPVKPVWLLPDEQRVLEALRALPEAQLADVLDYVIDLARRFSGG